MLPSRGRRHTRSARSRTRHAPGFMTRASRIPRRITTGAFLWTHCVHLGRCGASQTSMPRALRYRKQPGRPHHPGCWRPHNGLVAVMPDVPFLCHFRRAADICDEPPYTEIIRYLAIHRGVGDSAFTTLSYFDGVSFAKRASAPAGSRRVSVLGFGRSQPTEPRVARPRYVVLAHGGFEPGEEDKKDNDGCEEARYEFKDLIEVAHSSSSDDRPRSARRFRWRLVEAGEPSHGSEPVVGAWPMGANRVESGAADDAT